MHGWGIYQRTLRLADIKTILTTVLPILVTFNRAGYITATLILTTLRTGIMNGLWSGGKGNFFRNPISCGVIGVLNHRAIRVRSLDQSIERIVLVGNCAGECDGSKYQPKDKSQDKISLFTYHLKPSLPLR
jgi:hypothetical protein